MSTSSEPPARRIAHGGHEQGRPGIDDAAKLAALPGRRGASRLAGNVVIVQPGPDIAG